MAAKSHEIVHTSGVDDDVVSTYKFPHSCVLTNTMRI